MIDYLDGRVNDTERQSRIYLYLCSFTKVNSRCLNAKMDEISHSTLAGICGSCPPACNETNFNLETSFAYYPTPMEQRKMEKSLNLNMSLTEFRQEFVDLVFFLEGNVEIFIVEREQMDIDKLLANIGGAMGLFVGMSFLSVAEFFHLAYLAVSEMFCRHA